MIMEKATEFNISLQSLPIVQVSNGVQKFLNEVY